MNIILSTLLDIVTSVLNLLEAEGRLLRRAVMRLSWTLAYLIIAFFLLLLSAGFFLAGIYQHLASQLSPAASSLIVSLLALVLAMVFAGIAKCRSSDRK